MDRIRDFSVDAIFPTLPRWFTEPLHARTRWPSINMQDGSKMLIDPQFPKDPDVAHEYELLEVLYNKVFDRRFINTKASCGYIPAALPHVFYSSATLSNTTCLFFNVLRTRSLSAHPHRPNASSPARSETSTATTIHELTKLSVPLPRPELLVRFRG